MSASNVASKWSSWAPQILSLLRIVLAFVFITAGTTKMFGVPTAMPGGGTVPLWSQMWIGALLEIVLGALVLVGLFTRPAAFVLAGEMAVAYFEFHFPTSFWPTVNQGMPAMLYSLVWLYFSAAGAGPWSLDALRERRRTV
ncbi:MAG TPA: DoxX family protein [Thermoanaerobaculia bacterium]|jgi:putative oxidoreductase|nr:DoxX family protein [Thermoanaerobaculia bacterium]